MAIGAAREALADLHHALIEAARQAHERSSGGHVGPGELLQLLTQSPEFAWLQPLSGEPATQDFAAAVRRALESLLFAPAPPEGHSDSDFRQRYTAMLQAEPRVTMAHARVRQLLGALPEAEAASESESLHARHQAALLRKRRR